MKACSRPQYYRIRRMVQMVRDGSENGKLPNSGDFMKEFGVSRRTVARDLDFLRDEECAPLAYDDVRHGFRLTDETYTLPPVRISRREAFSFALARKLLAHYETTPLARKNPACIYLAIRRRLFCLNNAIGLDSLWQELARPPTPRRVARRRVPSGARQKNSLRGARSLLTFLPTNTKSMPKPARIWGSCAVCPQPNDR